MKMDITDGRIHVPMQLKRRGGRKLIILPASVSQGQKMPKHRDVTLVNGIARAYRWQALYERGKYVSLSDFVQKHRLNKSYAARVMRLNLLAPDIREAILDGLQPKGLSLADLMRPFPPEWQEQRTLFGFAPDGPATGYSA
jgi:hypothetical protein